MSTWRKDNEIVLIAKVDKEGVLGKVSKILALEEALKQEVWGLSRLIEVEEGASPVEERSREATSDSENQ